MPSTHAVPPYRYIRHLEVLLTPLRARLLVTLDRQRSMSDIADLLFIAPSTATYQVREMVRADLLVRTRTGSTVWVERSERGSGLLSIYGIDRLDGRSCGGPVRQGVHD